MLEPVTVFGEAVNVVIDYLSLLVLTLPIAIIGRNFHNEYGKKGEREGAGGTVACICACGWCLVG